MGGNQAAADHRRRKKQRKRKKERRKKERKEKREEMEQSDKWSHVTIPILLSGTENIWVKTFEETEVIETFLREQYGMQSWFDDAKESTVKKYVHGLLDREEWVEEVLWEKPRK